MFIFQIILSVSHFTAFFSPAFSVCSSCARPINTADSMVNTYAWIKATSNSNPFIKILNSTEATVSEPFKAGPHTCRYEYQTCKHQHRHVSCQHIGQKDVSSRQTAS